jgi:hypothetical protein
MAQQKNPFRVNAYGSNDLSAIESFFSRKEYKEQVFPQGLIRNQTSLRGVNQKYGKISPESVPLVLRERNLTQLRYTKDQRVLYTLDFVGQAWDDLVTKMRKYVGQGRLHEDSPFAMLQATQAWTSVDDLYDNHMKQLVYPLFVNEYLKDPQRQRSILSFGDFLREFSRFVRDTSSILPVTRSGFIESSFCSPYISGLIIDTAEATHDLDFPKGELYVHDLNFPFFASVAAQHGFLIDEDAPWRLIFNTSSSKGQEYMVKNLDLNSFTSSAVLEAFYEQDFYPSLVLDVGLLQIYLVSMYNAFAERQPNAFGPVISNDQASTIKSSATLREMVSGSVFDVETGTYGWLWMLKTLYYCRLYETKSGGNALRTKKGLRELFDVYYNSVEDEGGEEAAFVKAANHLQKNIL